MHRTLMIFVDGVGIGKPDPEINPFFKKKFRFLHEVFGDTPSLDNPYIEKDGKYLFPADPTLGVDDLPQSGTGQTSIFCGVNAPGILGHHFGPYPHSQLIPTLKTSNIFKEFLNLNKTVVFANAYPKIFFDYIDSGRRRLSATSLSCILSDVTLKNSADLIRGDALSAEVDNSRWITKLNYALPTVSPQTAARRLLKLSSEHDFTMFEYFYTDHIGHRRIKDVADEILEVFDGFLLHILQNIDEDTTLIICSDHGNFEDMSVKTHTRNPSLTITAGRNAKELAKDIKNISQIKDALLRYYL